MSARPAMIEDRESDEQRLGDMMLDLAEQAIRTCIDAGMLEQMRQRARRLLGDVVPVASVYGPDDREHLEAAPMGQIELSRVLGALKTARGSLRDPRDQAANILARNDVLRAMRGTAAGKAVAA